MENLQDTQDTQDIKIIADIISQYPPKRKYVKTKEPKTTKVCKICKVEKPLKDMVINEMLGLDRPIKMKNKCLDCYKQVSKDYYRDNKQKVLDFHKKLYEQSKKKYSVIIKFNDVNDLTNEYIKLKEKLENNQMSDVKLKTYKKKSGDGGSEGGSSNSTVNEI